VKNSDTSIIILAAGSSSRLGLPKQLLQFKNKSFLRLMAEKALEVRVSEVITVIGFESERMQRELEGLPIRFVLNRDWTEGIASSIRAGVSAIQLQVEAALISLCDQPSVTSELLSQLVLSCSHEKPIAASSYNQILGVPACFHRSIFPELLLLRGDVGAKRVIEEDSTRVAALHFPQAATDIDTFEDYQKQRLSDQ
jgi:molybdenum cofactor cytidylyltransferase